MSDLKGLAVIALWIIGVIVVFLAAVAFASQTGTLPA